VRRDRLILRNQGVETIRGRILFKILLFPLKILKIFLLLKYKIVIGILLGVCLVFLGHKGVEYTSTDEFCESCHVHPQAHKSWVRSKHHDTDSGVYVHCVECHLPPGGFDYLYEKARLGIQDVYGKLFKDPESFDWEEKSRFEHAVNHTFEASCKRCHQNLFPISLSPEGDNAHLHYSEHMDEINCIKCHLDAGHYTKKGGHKRRFITSKADEEQIHEAPAKVDAFEDFTELIPGSAVSFDMVALPGGRVTLGSPSSEDFRRDDETQRTVEVAPFWIARTEVTWDEYEAFYAQTAAEGRSSDTRLVASIADDVDAITGATPPWGAPDQGWGRGKRPAITMTHHAAEVYCQWLSVVTGRTYRLPTEAEWEYACRGGTTGAYFFEGDPDDFAESGFWNGIFGADEEPIRSYVIFAANSDGRTGLPSDVKPNPFGLLNMAGNVREFCSDEYLSGGSEEDSSDGREYIVRGGSFKSDAEDVRCAARDHTRSEAWLMTDPQMPKSVWWYSDCIDVGFRVVCEHEEKK